jgi:hypothetical protein
LSLWLSPACACHLIVVPWAIVTDAGRQWADVVPVIVTAALAGRAGSTAATSEATMATPISDPASRVRRKRFIGSPFPVSMDGGTTGGPLRGIAPVAPSAHAAPEGRLQA